LQTEYVLDTLKDLKFDETTKTITLKQQGAQIEDRPI
jgi:hypothetical protein